MVAGVRSVTLLRWTIGIGVLVGLYQAAAFYQGYRPSFDVGFFVCLAWLLYLPYYLLRTRGAQGWFWIIGLLLLIYLGTILQWAVYAAS